MTTLAPGMARLGTETAFEVLARAAALEREGRDIINLGIGQPDFPTPGNIVEAAVEALKDGQHGYTPATGVPPLREAVAGDLVARYGAEVSPFDLLLCVQCCPLFVVVVVISNLGEVKGHSAKPNKVFSRKVKKTFPLEGRRSGFAPQSF